MRLRSYLIYVILIFLIVGFLLIDGADPTYKTQSLQIQNASYSYDKGVNEVDQFEAINMHINKYPEDFVYTSLALHFKAKFHNISQNYDNLFQTGPLNEGLRLEASPQGDLALIYGTKNNSFKVILLTTDVQLNKWYSFYISVSNRNHLRIEVDDKLVVDTILSDMRYSITDLAIGTGYSNTRPFYGEISNFDLSLEGYKVTPFAPILGAARVVIYILIVGLIFILLFPSKRVRIMPAD